MAHILCSFRIVASPTSVSIGFHPVKVRQTFIGGSRKMIVYDDVEATEKIKSVR